MVRHSLAFAIFILIVTPSFAQELADPSRLDLDRLHGGEFGADGLGPLRWLADGRGYTTLEPAAEGGRDLVLNDPSTGRRTILVPADRFIPKGKKSAIGISDYAWSADGRRLLVFTNTRRVWRYHTRGDYQVLDLETGELRRIGKSLDSTWFQFAKFSPDSKQVAFVHRHDLWVQDLETAELRRLTENGSDTLINGTFDWVYEEEWGLRDGFRWSPDSRSIAFWQIDATGVREFKLVDYSSGLYPVIKTFPYPKVGETNPSARIGVVDLADGAIRWMKTPGDPRQNYLARMDWAPGPRELIIQHVNRLQNTIQVQLANADSGEVRTVMTDVDAAWAEVCDDLMWLEGGAEFTWVSERDGWRHVYRVNRKTGAMKLITPGDYDVVSIERIDDRGGQLYFIASPDDATRRFLYRCPLEGGSKPERLTPGDATGSHDYDISADARWAVHGSAAFGTPKRSAMISLPSHEEHRVLVANDRLKGKLAALDRGPSEFFRVDIGGGVEVDGWAIKPPKFDPARKYPLLVHVYGEPAGQTVRDNWGGGNYLWHLMLSQMGYIVVSFDNRGTPAPRGRAWRKSIYRQIGILAAKDQAAALRALKKKWSYIDGDRVGIWGWSGGGSMSLNAIFRYPDLYHTAVAVAFIANQRYYDTIYQERYMGLPDDNPAGFRDGSPITHAKHLKGNLLLVYGTGDDNCHYQNCEALVNELVRHGKQFSMMSYPNRSHGIHEGPGTRKHLYTLMTQYLREHLPLAP